MVARGHLNTCITPWIDNLLDIEIGGAAEVEGSKIQRTYEFENQDTGMTQRSKWIRKDAEGNECSLFFFFSYSKLCALLLYQNKCEAKAICKPAIVFAGVWWYEFAASI